MNYAIAFPRIADRLRKGFTERRCRICGKWKVVALFARVGKEDATCQSCVRGRKYAAPSHPPSSGNKPGWRWRQEPVLFPRSEQA